MGNGYTPGRPDDMAQMRALIEGLNRRITDLEKPMGGLQIRPPIAINAFTNSSGPLGVSTTFTTVASASITVPAGYSTVAVFAYASGWANASINGDYFYVQVKTTAPDGTWDTQTTAAIPAQSSTGTIYGFQQYPQGFIVVAATYTGVSGGTLLAECQIASQVGPWASSANTGGSVTVQAIFLP